MLRLTLLPMVVSIVLNLFATTVAAASEKTYESPYSKWTNGPSKESSFFPIAVWLQNPKNAGKYKAAGINTYVNLHKGPTEAQLSALKKADMKVICYQNETGRKNIDNPIIIGWMHFDEPDNAVRLKNGKGFGPPVDPGKIVANYEKLAANDPSRPILLNLGQGVAWDGWYGRGKRTNCPQDYPEYIKGCDIASFDIYPVVHSKPEVAGKLWYVAKGVDRLAKWSDGERIVWNCIECSQIKNEKVKPTPQHVKAEVWMSIIHGSTGIIYFVHEWKPKFKEAALLSDKQLLPAVTQINREIRSLATVINSPTIDAISEVSVSDKNVPVASMAKKHDGWTYIFSVGMRDGKTDAAFNIAGLPAKTTIEVLGENRTIKSQEGAFSDHFEPWDVHLYRYKKEVLHTKQMVAIEN